MPIKYHDDFMEDVRVMIANITACKRKGDKVGLTAFQLCQGLQGRLRKCSPTSC